MTSTGSPPPPTSCPAAPLAQYEAQQAPLYYFLAAVPHQFLWGYPIQAQLVAQRFFNVILGSLLVPLAWFTAYALFSVRSIAVATSAFLVLMPGAASAVSRAGNESLALVLASLLIAGLAIRPHWPVVNGLLLGLALLTKAYFLTAITGLVLWAAWTALLTRSVLEARRMAMLLLAAALLSTPWYAKTFATTGSLSGEQHDVAAASRRPSELLSAAVRVNWAEAADSTFKSHVWMGGWSFLGVRSWMYRVMLGLFAASLLGYLVALIRCRPIPACRDVARLFALMFAFAAGLAYHAMSTFLVHGISATTGWYIHSFALAEAILLPLGLTLLTGRVSQSRWIAICACLWFAIEAFGLHVYQMPYYAGMLQRTETGGLPAFSVMRYFAEDLYPIFERLSETKNQFLAPGGLIALWGAYWIANLGAMCAAFTASPALRPPEESGR